MVDYTIFKNGSYFFEQLEKNTKKMVKMDWFDEDGYAEGCKKECFGTISTILELSDILRNRGLSALEKKAKEIDDDLFCFLISMIIDDTDPATMERVAFTRYATIPSMKEWDGELERFLYLMQMYGCLMIQSGETTRFIKKALLALLPTKWEKDYRKYLGNRPYKP